MKRLALQKLIEWKNTPNRKPLIIQGARQIGKTWLMREFGKLEYKNTVYISFENNEVMQKLFSIDMDIKRIIKEIEFLQEIQINANDTLIIFDEIQDCNNALVSLKYFCENAPQYNIIAAGSFLGVALHEGYSFPVGKVDVMTLYPLSFYEFLDALGQRQLCELLNNPDTALITILKNKFIENLRYYFYVGGMPEAVLSFSNDRNTQKVREIQKTILSGVEKDFSKHIAAASIPKISSLWDSIPDQLSKEKKKFVYSDIKSGARAREYEDALTWLIKYGIVYKVSRVSRPNMPLSAYKERAAFKLYMLDVGLLCAMVNLPAESLFVAEYEIFNHFKGAICEQFVLQELQFMKDFPIFYWGNDNGTSEVDFIIQYKNEIIPIEVKSSTNLKSKSLKVYMETYKPNISIRASLADCKKNAQTFEIPLYLIEIFMKII
jgi:predicted AAA+ superfamily ATPase